MKGMKIYMSKYVLITGASRGIGNGIASILAQKGYNLVLTCRNNASLLEVFANELRETYSNIHIHTYTGDIGDSHFCDELFNSLNIQNISIDILINNAGISHVGLLQDMTHDEWNTTVNTNLSSIFYMCRLAIPQMLATGAGKIINISSVWGNVGASCEVAYSATKGGVNAFTKALAKELAPSNIQVNAIAFGAIDTEMNNHLSNEEKAILTDEIPMGRMGTIYEAGKMVLTLINSPDYLTGQIISMDGGWC